MKQISTQTGKSIEMSALPRISEAKRNGLSPIYVGQQMMIQMATEAFDQLDVNKDGKLDRNELKQMALAAFDSLFPVSLQELPEGAREAEMDRYFEQIDTSKDGYIQRDEWLQFFKIMYDDAMEQSQKK